MELDSPRKALLAALSPPKKNVIALRDKSEWEVAHFTTNGPIDDDTFSIGTMTRYIAELQGYVILVDIVKSALLFVSINQ